MQPLKASPLIVFTPSLITTAFKLIQSLNAEYPIVVILLGNVISLKPIVLKYELGTVFTDVKY